MPRVSVISCVYNLENIVLETVESVLGQTYADFNFVMVDDGSTDRTVEILETVRDPRFKLVRAPHSGLPAVGRMRAITASTPAEFIAIADADDVWLPHKLERQVEFFDRHRDVGIVCTKAHHLIEGRLEPSPDRGLSSATMSAAEALQRLLKQNFICTPSAVIRADIGQVTNDLFTVDPRLCGTEDFDLWMRLAESGVSFGYIDEPLVLYRVRPDSVSRNRARNLFGDITVINAALARRPQAYAPHRRLVHQRLAYLHRELAGCKFRAGESGAWADLRRAFSYEPLNMKSWCWAALGLIGPENAERVLSMRKRWSSSKPVSTSTILKSSTDSNGITR